MTIYDADYLAEQNLQKEVLDEFRKDAGVEDPVAVDQEEVQQEENVSLTEGYQPQAEEEPLSDKEMNFRALREELAYIKVDRDRLREEFEDFRRSEVQRKPEPRRERQVDSIEDDDIITGAQLKKSLMEREQEYQQRLADQESFLQELSVKSQNPDYEEVTTKYGLPLIEKEPDLAQGFLAANNKAAYLYKISKMAMLADRPAPEPVQRQQNRAERIVENSRKPGSLSNPVGGSANLSQADYYASISDAEFAKLVQKNLEEV